MTALQEELLRKPKMAKLKRKYEAARIPFDTPFEHAVTMAISMLSGVNPAVRLLIGPVAKLLSATLQEELKKKTAKNWAGRLFRKFFGAQTP